MTDTVIRTAYCDRSKHAIARVYLDRIEIRAATVGRDAVAENWEAIPRSELEGCAGYGVPVMCACGRLAQLDLVALVNDGRTVLHAYGAGTHGASHRRGAAR